MQPIEDRAVRAGHYSPAILEKPAADPRLWPLDDGITFLNHGSFGSCPWAVLKHQEEWRNRLEKQPIQFFVTDLEVFLDQARAKLADFIGADTDNLVFVPNATTGVNTVLRSLEFGPQDDLLVTNQEYNACRNALNFVAERSGARIIEVRLPFPLSSEDEIIRLVRDAVTPRTRLALLDHVTSQTGLILPIQKLVSELENLGVETLVDGAHAPGMIPLNLKQINATYYTGNCHKWLCSPKGAAFLYVREDCQQKIRPLCISHGANSPRTDRSRFQVEFGWTGTSDPTPWLCVPKAIDYMGTLLPGGWLQIQERNRQLALAGRQAFCRELNVALPAPECCIGALASIPIPNDLQGIPPSSPLYADPLQILLREQYQIEIPIIPWPKWPARLIRLSSQLYNSLPQYQRCARTLVQALSMGVK